VETIEKSNFELVVFELLLLDKVHGWREIFTRSRESIRSARKFEAENQYKIVDNSHSGGLKEGAAHQSLKCHHTCTISSKFLKFIILSRGSHLYK